MSGQASVIGSVVRVGSDLRFNFPSAAGRSYVIESRGSLTSGAWTPVPGTERSGTGGVIEIILANVFTEPTQFYRVKAQ
jgi:hypothetical protein